MRFDVYLLPDLEVGRLQSAIVSRLLVTLLRLPDMELEVFMEFPKINGKFPSAGGSHVALWVNG